MPARLVRSTPRGNLVERLYELVTGTPYRTVGGHASRDFGPTPGAEIAEVFDLSRVSDRVLMERGPQILAQARMVKQAQQRAAQLAKTGGAR